MSLYLTTTARRLPIVAGGNSNGDIPMLHYTGGPPHGGPRLLLLHDDPEREFDYTAGAEKSLERATDEGWTVVSIKNDSATVFADAGGMTNHPLSIIDRPSGAAPR